MGRICRWTASLAIAFTVLMVPWPIGWAGKFNRQLSIGDKAPQWKDLVGVDDQKHSLADYGEAKLLVIVFISNHCPVARDYEDRLIALAKEYEELGVELVAINVSTLAIDRLERMKERAKEKAFPFEYLYDPRQKVGRDYGATHTPHAFLLDRERRIAYMGAIDDGKGQGYADVKRHYLRDAIAAALKGSKPDRPETRQFGCAIEYE